MSDIRQLSRACIRELSQTLIAERQNRDIPKFSLDSSQQKVINSNANFMRIVAPAGSGKTQTLVAKAVDILSSSEGRVLCLTFTNAAAEEFRGRAQLIAPSLISRLHVSTLNKFGYDFLQYFNQSLKIVDPNNQTIGGAYRILKQLMQESELWSNQSISEFYAPLLELSDMTKSLGFYHGHDESQAQEHYEFVNALEMLVLFQDRISEVHIDGFIKSAFLRKWLPFWKKFCEALWNANLITLEDQKYWALHKLATHEATQNRLRNRNFTHVLVDEFQDINILDLLLVQQIVHITNASLIIVGDDDQCIYEWRGCKSNFLQKPDDFFKAIRKDDSFESIILTNNYRCPRNIVIHSKQLIKKNINRIDKEMIPVREEDANIRLISLPAAYLSMNIIDELIANITCHHPNHSVALVGRKKCQLIPLQILLTKREAKFKIDKDLNIFQGNAFNDFRLFLGLIEIYDETKPFRKNVENTMALLNRIAKNPISNRETQEIKQWLLGERPQDLREAVEAFGNYTGKFKKGYVQPSKVAQDLDNFLESDSVVTALRLASSIFKGFQKDFVKSKEDIFYSDPPFSHLADLAVNYGDDFDGFLHDIDRAIQRSNQDDPRQASIELTTALRTKGREFDTVIVLDTNDGIWPNKKSVDSGRIEEERRLFYVTITRAKNNLLFFENKRIQGQYFSSSPFIKEMGLPEDAWLSHPDIPTISSKLLSQLQV